ncbi:MAG: LysR family transcriptional regulator [Pyramidobacter sp.]|uniref:LysR family transcriptional regulator n=1 Tax=Pyramidobacter sp. TaxID=1943581 RepID=UPI002A840895|nr:LysR family transcriptional regulator [Pyramidobacter sp.]MDY4031792.1 LysR family transcriptional regulator [Pyramidobacter sp.]
MELREQKYVLTIAECKNISQAAARLHLTQPALSAFLLKLERAVGSSLFERHGRELVLTKIGELYVEKASRIMDIEREYDQELAALLHDREVPLKVGVQTLRAPKLVPRLMIAFRKYFPQARPEFVENFGSTLYRMLRHRELDAVLCSSVWAEVSSFGVEQIRLRDDCLLLATPHGYAPVAQKARPGSPYPIVCLSDIADETFILMPRAHSMRRLIDLVQQRQQGTVLRHIREANRQEGAVHLASFGEGLTFTLDSYVSYFQLPRPVDFYQIDGAPQTSISLIYLKDRLETRAVAALTQIGKAAFGETEL